jgi:16S rRNA (cytidine1402-2'-O)-methyltransferase
LKEKIPIFKIKKVLFIIPTPIGNLKDITLRALDALRETDVIFSEDTRKTAILLNHYQIKCNLQRYNEHNERSVQKVISELESGKKVGLVTDGGTPCISDPGWKLVKICREKNLPVTVLPGANAVTCAFSGSGIPAGTFTFLGFLPRKKGQIIKAINSEKAPKKTLVIYESPYRIISLLETIEAEFGNTLNAVVAREMTKVYEEWIHGSVSEVKAKLSEKPKVKGEIVLMLYQNKNED